MQPKARLRPRGERPVAVIGAKRVKDALFNKEKRMHGNPNLGRDIAPRSPHTGRPKGRLNDTTLEARRMAVGEPFIVQHLHDPARRWGSTPFGNAIVSNAFVFTQVEMTGSIWLLEPEPILRRSP